MIAPNVLAPPIPFDKFISGCGFLLSAGLGHIPIIRFSGSAGIDRHVVWNERVRAAMLADVPVGESPIGGSAQLPP
jgi:hypothetical protein